jgi:hypothetical protein
MTELRQIDHDTKPTKFRRQQDRAALVETRLDGKLVALPRHEPVERVHEQIADANGDIGNPWCVIGLLTRWERAGRISAEMRQAGDEFHRLFRRACLDDLRAADLSRPGGCGSRERHRGSVYAQDEITRALRALGGFSSPLGSSAWFVIGCEFSIRDWAARGIWNGRPVDQKVAAGILIGALGGLQKHFGF